MNRTKWGAVIALALILISSGGYWLWSRHQTSIPVQDEPVFTIYIRGSVADAGALRALLDDMKGKVIDTDINVIQSSDLDPVDQQLDFDLAILDIDSLKARESHLDAFPSSHPWIQTEGHHGFFRKAEAVLGLPFYEDDYVGLVADKTKVATPPKTWFGLAMTGLSFTNRRSKSYGLAMGEDAEILLPFFSRLHAPSSQEETTAIESGFAGLAQLRHEIPIVPLDCSGPCAENLFRTGKAPMALLPVDKIMEFSRSMGSDKVTIMSLPNDEGVFVSDRRTQYLVKSKTISKIREDQLEKMLSYWQSKDGQNHIFRRFSKVPSLAVSTNLQLDDPTAAALASFIKTSTRSRSPEDHRADRRILESVTRDYLTGKLGSLEASENLLAALRPKSSEEGQK